MPFQTGISGTHLESCKHEWSCGHHDLHSSSVCSGYGLSSALSLWAHLCQLDWHFQTHCKYQGCSNPSAAAAAQDQGLEQCRAPALLTRQWGWGPSWAQPCPPVQQTGLAGIHTTQTCSSATPRAGWGLRSSVWLHSLWEATSACAQGACWAFGLGPCFCCKNKVKNNGLTGWWL